MAEINFIHTIISVRPFLYYILSLCDGLFVSSSPLHELSLCPSLFLFYLSLNASHRYEASNGIFFSSGNIDVQFISANRSSDVFFTPACPIWLPYDYTFNVLDAVFHLGTDKSLKIHYLCDYNIRPHTCYQIFVWINGMFFSLWISSFLVSTMKWPCLRICTTLYIYGLSPVRETPAFSLQTLLII